MEQKEPAYFNNLLLDNIDLPTDITLLVLQKKLAFHRY